MKVNEQATSKENTVGHDTILLDCTLRKIQQNIKVGGAKLQRTVQYISADIRYTARATYSMVLSTFGICTNLH